MGNTGKAVTRVICLWCGRTWVLAGLRINKKPRSCEQGSEASNVGEELRPI
jgi:hypothetical protein